ncbi:hypothetical protein HS1_002094 [Candidatus Desulfofervidus auxilii]|uniref:Uncharacterized protein n=1 Tax=Desulfofervidus auxilii TaxID=1621989 RepID=A0A7U4QM52_DESA2|nr:hypothetical protein [Candidatus Desulfofervidus auxilii]AMM41880.1 hypothetical protein HS1_002094 [Candidatus Desulfofervidus auxilii]
MLRQNACLRAGTGRDDMDDKGKGIVGKYWVSNREKIRENVILKEKIIVILDFLIERSSAIGFLVREETKF